MMPLRVKLLHHPRYESHRYCRRCTAITLHLRLYQSEIGAMDVCYACGLFNGWLHRWNMEDTAHA